VVKSSQLSTNSSAWSLTQSISKPCSFFFLDVLPWLLWYFKPFPNHQLIRARRKEGRGRGEKALWRFRVVNSLYRVSDIFVVILWKGHIHDELGVFATGIRNETVSKKIFSVYQKESKCNSKMAMDVN